MIKVTIGGEPQKEKEIPFPKLMVLDMENDERVIILATGQDFAKQFVGVCVFSNTGRSQVGQHYSGWSTNFTDYNEHITLQNITE